MTGCSHPHLVLAESGHWYVVKSIKNPQHRRVLINEVMAAQLLGLTGISRPGWAFVTLDEAIVTTHPSFSLQSGLHFGSAVPLRPAYRSIRDQISPWLFLRVVNKEDFISVLVFDIWVDHRDGRQAVFAALPGRRLHALMIDNGFTFGFDGFEWQMGNGLAYKEYPLARGFYNSEGTSAIFEGAISRISDLTKKDLISIVKSVPAAWVQSDSAALVALVEQLLRRKEILRELVDNWRRRYKERGAHCARPCRIHPSFKDTHWPAPYVKTSKTHFKSEARC